MEELIKELNSPENQSSSDRVQDIQRRIQQLQREKSGWEKGFDLLRSDDEIFPFYGALTLTIKISADWEKDDFDHDESAKRLLLEGLLNSYAHLVNTSDASLVLLKLCSTLTAYFVKDNQWNTAVKQVAASLVQGQYVTSSIAHSSGISQLLLSMNFRQMRGILWFASTLVEGVTRLDTGSSRSSQLIERLADNSKDVWLIMMFCLDGCNPNVSAESISSQNSTSRRLLRRDEYLQAAKIVLPMILSWMEQLLGTLKLQDSDEVSVVDMTKDCVSKIFVCFSHNILQDLTIQTLTELARSNFQIFQSAGFAASEEITNSRQAASWVNELQEGDFSPEAVRYVEFLINLIDWGNLSSSYLEKKSTLAKLSNLKQLMYCPGAAVVEDEVVQLILEALNTVVEQFNEWDEITKANSTMQAFITEVCLAALKKCCVPIEEIDTSSQTWDTDDRARFQDFRNDVSDFMASAFVALGPPLIEALAQTTILIDSETNWTMFEASVFCLIELSETMDHDPERYDSIIHAIMSSPLWLAATNGSGTTPSKVRQTVIKFVSQQTGYLRRNIGFLIPCLQFLFQSLPVSGAAQGASKAIQTLCYSERQVLIEALPQFMDSLSSLELLEPSIRHRIYSSVAAIVQALPTEAGKIDPLRTLLENISTTLRRSPEDSGLDAIAAMVDMLQALAAIGRGLREPSDMVINLDEDSSPAKQVGFWTMGPGQETQQTALSLCNLALSAPGIQPTAEIIEFACDFVKSGYTEKDPSPFKFSAAISVDFLTAQVNVKSPNIDAVMGCASTFLASENPQTLGNYFDKLMEHILDEIKMIVTQSSQNGIIRYGDFPASSIAFFTRLLPKWSSHLLNLSNAQEKLGSVLDLALTLFAGSDTLPRRSAASFFTAVLDLTGPNSNLNEWASSELAKILDTYTVPIVASILNLVAGECARSEIEAVTEPLRKLISKPTPATRRLLKEAMNQEAAVLSSKAYAATTLAQRLRFIAQVEGLRGARKTTEIVREFWISCRGDAFGYVT